MYLGTIFLTLAILSGGAVGFCLIKLQWQYSLLNRYISPRKGGQYYGPSPPIDPIHEMRNAWPVLKTLDTNLDNRDCAWPVYEETGYRIASFLAVGAAIVLLAYLWTPIWLAWSGTPDQDGTDGNNSKTSREVRFHTTVFFESNLSALSPAAERSLHDAIRGLMPLNNDRCVLVEGHTDDKASAQYNLELGRMRAEQVLSILESEGVPRASVLLSSFGESRPAATDHSQTALAQNRRVEISLTECPGLKPAP